MKWRVYHHRVLYSLLAKSPKTIPQICKDWQSTRDEPYYKAIPELYKHAWLAQKGNLYGVSYKNFVKWFIDFGIVNYKKWHELMAAVWRKKMWSNEKIVREYIQSKTFKDMMNRKVKFIQKPDIRKIPSFMLHELRKPQKEKAAQEMRKLYGQIFALDNPNNIYTWKEMSPTIKIKGERFFFP